MDYQISIKEGKVYIYEYPHKPNVKKYEFTLIATFDNVDAFNRYNKRGNK